MNAHVSIARKKWHYANEDGTLNKLAIREEINRRVKREWSLCKGDSITIRHRETRYILQIALQQRDAVREALRTVAERNA